MMLHKTTFLYILFLLMPFNLLTAQESDLLNYTNSVKYANHLFENGQYDLSATEYERIVYLEPTDTLAKLRLVQSYRLLNNLQTAKVKLDAFFPDCELSCNKALALENFRIIFLGKQYNESMLFLNNSRTVDPETLTEMKTAVLLMQHKWSDAKTLTGDYMLSNSPTLLMSELRNISLNGESIRYKNPFVAAGLSGIIPGAGKLYTENWKDGIYAFVVVSALSYLTYSSFEKNGTNPYGFIFGSVAFSFYTANIYGSFKSAIRHNQNRNRNTVKDIERLLMEKK